MRPMLSPIVASDRCVRPLKPNSWKLRDRFVCDHQAARLAVAPDRPNRRRCAMPRRKRENRLLRAAQTYISQHLSELGDVPLRLQLLDGPPDSPRYAATIEACIATVCPRGFCAQAASSGQGAVL